MKSFRLTTLITIILFTSSSLLQSMSAPYHSAGVLPYAINSQNKVLLLVGLEPGRGNQAFDFGGKQDPEDNNNARYTAAREGTEELLFLYDQDPQEFERILTLYRTYGKRFQLYKTNSKTYKYFTETLKVSPSSLSRGYITYFVKVPYNAEIPKFFIDRRKSHRLPSSWIEKNQLVWLSLDEVIKALATNNNDNNFSVPSTQGLIRIFPHFAQSLRTAFQNGTLAQLR